MKIDGEIQLARLSLESLDRDLPRRAAANDEARYLYVIILFGAEKAAQHRLTLSIFT